MVSRNFLFHVLQKLIVEVTNYNELQDAILRSASINGTSTGLLEDIRKMTKL
jgi:hypothetical protein